MRDTIWADGEGSSTTSVLLVAGQVFFRDNVGWGLVELEPNEDAWHVANALAVRWKLVDAGHEVLAEVTQLLVGRK